MKSGIKRKEGQPRVPNPRGMKWLVKEYFDMVSTFDAELCELAGRGGLPRTLKAAAKISKKIRKHLGRECPDDHGDIAHSLQLSVKLSPYCQLAPCTSIESVDVALPDMCLDRSLYPVRRWDAQRVRVQCEGGSDFSLPVSLLMSEKSVVRKPV